jgi:hypothetical protein
MAYWTGSIWCNLDVKEPSTKYEYHETQTWVLDGNPPINDIYNALWTSEGWGTKTVSQVGMTLKTNWTINGSRPQNPADVVQFASRFDSRIVNGLCSSGVARGHCQVDSLIPTYKPSERSPQPRRVALRSGNLF